MWLLLLEGPWSIPGSVHCSAPSGTAPSSTTSFLTFVAMNAPSSFALSWIVMLSAMMLPALIAPVHHIKRRSFKHRRARSVMLFLFGYGCVWMAFGGALLALELAARFFGGEGYLPVAGIVSIAMLWQFSPLKQRCLNRCHGFPKLAAFGSAADWDALAFGLTQGIWCAGSCWALMLLPMLLSRGHVAAMAIVAVLIYCERLEHPGPPCWRWRGFGRTARMLIARTRMRLKTLRALPASS